MAAGSWHRPAAVKSVRQHVDAVTFSLWVLECSDCPWVRRRRSFFFLGRLILKIRGKQIAAAAL